MIETLSQFSFDEIIAAREVLTKSHDDYVCGNDLNVIWHFLNKLILERKFTNAESTKMIELFSLEAEISIKLNRHSN